MILNPIHGTIYCRSMKTVIKRCGITFTTRAGLDGIIIIQMKTRNTMNEIEIRFEGKEIYDYGIEVRTDDDELPGTVLFNQ